MRLQVLGRLQDRTPISTPLRSKETGHIPPRSHVPLQSSKVQRLCLQDVQSHILGSSSTRLLYVVVCQIFYQQIENPQDISKPSDDIVKGILESSWPTFVPVPERMANGDLGVIWGQTDKLTTVSEIQLNPDLIVALENAPEVSKA